MIGIKGTKSVHENNTLIRKKSFSVLIFIPSLRPGGKERRLIELIKYLKSSKKYLVHLVLMERKIHYKYIEDLGIDLIYLERKSMKWDLKVFMKFYSLCRKLRPSIIHSWSAMTTLYASPVKFLLGIPIIDNQISTSNPKLLNTRALDSLIFKFNSSISDAIIANSRAGLNAYRVVGDKSQVIYNGVYLKRFDKYKSANLAVLSSVINFNIIMVASFMKHKNYELLFDVAKEISNMRDDVTFTCVGGGPTFPEYQNKIKVGNITNINLLGLVQNVEEVIDKADIGILFTDSEGVSNVILEYMAMRKPVITNDRFGGSSEIIDQGNSGYITSDDVGSIVKIIQSLLDDEDKRVKMGEKGRNIIENRFTISAMGSKYEALYRSIRDE
jgi:glycosyltransferase involved in cell wall biosynthesis